MRKGFRRDSHTGRMRRVDALKSRIAKRSSRKRKGKHLKPSVIRKMKLSLKRTRRTGRTKTGRRSLFKKRH